MLQPETVITWLPSGLLSVWQVRHVLNFAVATASAPSVADSDSDHNGPTVRPRQGSRGLTLVVRIFW
jgi:hypothetical protein